MRTIVLIVNHDDEGAFGLTMTRPTDQRLSDLIELSIPTGTIRQDDFIFEGGPVEGPLLAVHDLTGIGAPICDQDAGIWLTGDEDHLRLLLQRTDARVRFISQYSGWGPGQLDMELRSGGWLVGQADSQVIFANPDQIWETAVKRCGHEILSSISPGLQFNDPSVN
ncbi:YqgE/AlgH family protein [Stieleria sp. JC731]|uniref:YqgE/AlgH family protein n=1 Tax=Pirellulaceae TaxID=2691357 RepID=UPI001E562130|nr:YqgE/AlgH family protein [Stieleria sp. JC731]